MELLIVDIRVEKGSCTSRSRWPADDFGADRRFGKTMPYLGGDLESLGAEVTNNVKLRLSRPRARYYKVKFRQCTIKSPQQGASCGTGSSYSF
jgi:hypothetical protein